MAILTKKQMLLKSRSSLSRLIIVVVDQFLPVTLLSDVASCVVYYMGKVYVLLKDAFFPQGTFNWRHAKNEFFRHYFAYYQEEFIDFNKRPDLRGLVTEWMPAEELVKHMKLGDLVEFKGTTSFTLFHHWSVCVRVNTEIEARKRTTSQVRMLHLNRISSKALSSSELWNYGFMYVSAKVKIKTLSEAHQSRLCRINNSLDLLWRPFDGKDVAKFAMTCRGCARYNGVLWNCEHFVKCCRYGHGESYQTEMISTLVSLYLSFISLLSIIQMPAWISLYMSWCCVVWYYVAMQTWRCLENVAFVFMRKHDIPLSIFNIPECFPKMTYTEMFYVFNFWLFSIALRFYLMAFLLYYWDVSLLPKFNIHR